MAARNPTQLFRVNLDTADAIDAFAEVLHPFLPYSLPILGCLYSGDLDSENNVGKLFIWSSFAFEPKVSPPALFSIIADSGWSDMQMRYFCSTEVLLTPPTPEEEQHVRGCLNEFIHALKVNDPVVQCINSQAALCREDGEAILLGSLHDRWVPCLASGMPLAQKTPCVKFVSRPDYRGDEPAWDASEGDLEIGELREEDLAFVLSRATFPRSLEYMKGRIPYSVCIRRKGETGPPVAWELLYTDGSSGMLHVEPEYRKAGLGRKCVAALNAKMAQRHRHSDADERLRGRYPFVRWEVTDVMVGNPAGLHVAITRKGWKHTWMNHWVPLRIVT